MQGQQTRGQALLTNIVADKEDNPEDKRQHVSDIRHDDKIHEITLLYHTLFIPVDFQSLTPPTPKGGGFLRGTHSRELYSQRVRQKPSSHSLDIESVVTFAQDVGRSVGLGME